MPKPTNISLVFFIKRLDGKPCNHSDAETFDQIMCDDDFLVFDDEQIVLNDELYDTPEEIGGRVCLAFYIQVEHSTDPKAGHRKMLNLVKENAGLYLPDEYEVDEEQISVNIK
jgi:hypothetical protein